MKILFSDYIHVYQAEIHVIYKCIPDNFRRQFVGNARNSIFICTYSQEALNALCKYMISFKLTWNAYKT